MTMAITTELLKELPKWHVEGHENAIGPGMIYGLQLTQGADLVAGEQDLLSGFHP